MSATSTCVQAKGPDPKTKKYVLTSDFPIIVIPAPDSSPSNNNIVIPLSSPPLLQLFTSDTSPCVVSLLSICYLLIWRVDDLILGVLLIWCTENKIRIPPAEQAYAGIVKVFIGTNKKTVLWFIG